MLKLKYILNHQAFFPILFLYYGIAYILFGEIYTAGDGLGTDGYVYASLVIEFTNSSFFDSFYVHRILPSFLIRAFLLLFKIDMNVQTIFISFQILNLICIVISCWIIKKILLQINIAFKIQLLVLVLFILNFSVLKFPFYLPVMTDTFALMLSSLLFYWYLKNNTLGLIISTIALSFTWPMGFYQGLIMILFPFRSIEFKPLEASWKRIISLAIFLFIVLLSIYLIVIENKDTSLIFVSKIDRSLLFISIPALAFIYIMFFKLLFNKHIINLKEILLQIKYKRILISIGVYFLIHFIIYLLHPKLGSLYSLSFILTNPILLSLVKPFISIVSHVSYFGIVVCLLILFWNKICETIAYFGFGLIAALVLNLFLFGINTETRGLINLLPWFIIILAKAINFSSFSNAFYFIVVLFGFISSKIWLIISYDINTSIDNNGNIGYPNQLFYMNLGPWMNEEMYIVQGSIALLFLSILFFLLYRFEISSTNKIKVIKKYTNSL